MDDVCVVPALIIWAKDTSSTGRVSAIGSHLLKVKVLFLCHNPVFQQIHVGRCVCMKMIITVVLSTSGPEQTKASLNCGKQGLCSTTNNYGGFWRGGCDVPAVWYERKSPPSLRCQQTLKYTFIGKCYCQKRGLKSAFFHFLGQIGFTFCVLY